MKMNNTQIIFSLMADALALDKNIAQSESMITGLYDAGPSTCRLIGKHFR